MPERVQALGAVATAAATEAAIDMHQQRFAERPVEGLFEDALDRAHRPIIVANPANDAAFRALIDSVLLSGVWRPETLETLLRTRYPNVLVRPRELAGERTQVWYVYRDGHWIRSDIDAGFR